MSRLLAGIVVIALAGMVIAGCASRAASSRRAPGAASAVTVTPRLKRLLAREISTLRAAQPSARLRAGQPPARPSVPRSLRRLVIPGSGVPCFVVGGSPCSEIPCREFASVHRRAAAPACARRAPARLVLVSRP